MAKRLTDRNKSERRAVSKKPRLVSCFILFHLVTMKTADAFQLMCNIAERKAGVKSLRKSCKIGDMDILLKNSGLFKEDNTLFQ